MGFGEQLHQAEEVEELAGGVLEGRAGLFVEGSRFHG